MTGPAARNPLPGEPEHRQRWTDAHPTPEQVAEALAWLGERAPYFGLHREDPAQVHAATLVRAALAAETESHVEYRVVGQAPDVGQHNTCTTREIDQAETWAAHWRSRWHDVRVESREVTTTRGETPWTEQQT